MKNKLKFISYISFLLLSSNIFLGMFFKGEILDIPLSFQAILLLTFIPCLVNGIRNKCWLYIILFSEGFIFMSFSIIVGLILYYEGKI